MCCCGRPVCIVKKLRQLQGRIFSAVISVTQKPLFVPSTTCQSEARLVKNNPSVFCNAAGEPMQIYVQPDGTQLPGRLEYLKSGVEVSASSE